MTTPSNGQQGPFEPAQPGTREPGEDVPRQQAPGWEYGQQGAPGQPGGYGPPGAYGAARPGYPGSTGQLPYLNGGKVGFGRAVGQGLANLLNFRGRASRSAFWWFVVFTIIVQIIVNGIVNAASHGNQRIEGVSFLSTLLTLAVSVRRLHDINRSGFWWLIGLVPIVGWIVLLFFYVKRGTRSPNRFDVPFR
jgi:uncharacterized membrane protein YhaH (DUF805 family)